MRTALTALALLALAGSARAAVTTTFDMLPGSPLGVGQDIAFSKPLAISGPFETIVSFGVREPLSVSLKATVAGPVDGGVLTLFRPATGSEAGGQTAATIVSAPIVDTATLGPVDIGIGEYLVEVTGTAGHGLLRHEELHVTTSVTAPEPATWVMLALGFMALAVPLRRRRAASVAGRELSCVGRRGA